MTHPPRLRAAALLLLLGLAACSDFPVDTPEPDGRAVAADAGISPDITAPDWAGTSASSDAGWPAPYQMVVTLASPRMTGRKSGTPGGDRAASYLADLLHGCGVAPYGETPHSYFQTFAITPIVHTGPMTMSVSAPAQSFTYRKQWRPARTTPGASLSARLAFLGHGLDDPKFDEYRGVSVSGRVVVVLRGCPPGQPNLTGCDDLAKVDAAHRHGAAGMVLVSEDEHNVEIWGGSQGGSLLPIPAVVAKVEVADTLLPAGRSVAALRARPAGSGPASFLIERTLSLTLSRKAVPGASAYNVLGRIPGLEGSGGKAVLAGAHYDHLGFDEPPSAYFPGALDNASGTAVVVDAACRLASRGERPKKNLVFGLWAAEEDGLIGSFYFIGSGHLAPARIATAFNLDMVGGKGEGSLAVDLSPAHQKDLTLLLAPVVARLGTAVNYGPITTGNSDHAAFVQQNLPTVYLRGPYPPYMQYHTRGDTVDQLSPQKLDELGELLAEMLWAAAN